jgi:hypothetical protein
MDTLLNGLQHQQAKIDDHEAFTDMVMGRIEKVESGKLKVESYYLRQLNTQLSIFNFQFSIRVAASVALMLIVGFFFVLRTQTVDPTTMLASNSLSMDKYRIDLSHIPPDGTSRDLYRCYQEAKREQTFYHNELIKYSHENM